MGFDQDELFDDVVLLFIVQLVRLQQISNGHLPGSSMTAVPKNVEAVAAVTVCGATFPSDRKARINAGGGSADFRFFRVLAVAGHL